MQLDILGLQNPDAPTLVLSSGLGGVAGFWQPQLAALTARYRVVIYDQRGTGRSADSLPEGYSMAMMAAELAAALAQHGILRFSLIGHALGGLMGMQLALDYPERIERIAVINGWLTLHPHTRRCFQVRQDLLLNVGVPVMQALHVVGETTGNEVINSAMRDVQSAVRDGQPMSSALRNHKVFPEMVTQMIEVGEESGQISQMLDKVADFYDREVDSAAESLTASIEPIMVLVMGAVVGGMVICLYLPMFTIYQNIQGN